MYLCQDRAIPSMQQTNKTLNNFHFFLFLSVYEWYQILEKDINLVWRPDVSFVNVIDTKILPLYGNEETFQLWFSASDNHMEHYQAIKGTNYLLL